MKKDLKQLSLFDNEARPEPVSSAANEIKVTSKPKEYLSNKGVVCVAYWKQKNIIGLGKIKIIVCEYTGRKTEFHSKKQFQHFLNHN